MILSQVLMCRPQNFQVQYSINPWMQPGSVDSEKALYQWKQLKSVYEGLGITVHVIGQQARWPDMVFAADQGIGTRERWLKSRFRYPERQGEPAVFGQWYEERGYELVEMPRNIYFEGGGETWWWRGRLLMGTGFRTSRKAAQVVGELLQAEVVVLELLDERFYHLDTCLFPLNAETVFYYPPAFSQQSRALLEATVPNLLELTEQAAFGFAANSVVVGGTVVCQQGNGDFVQQLKRFGYRVIEVNVSEFIKAGGGVHCLTGMVP